jgi:hypothetical protein
VPGPWLHIFMYYSRFLAFKGGFSNTDPIPSLTSGRTLLFVGPRSSLKLQYYNRFCEGWMEEWKEGRDDGSRMSLVGKKECSQTCGRALSVADGGGSRAIPPETSSYIDVFKWCFMSRHLGNWLMSSVNVYSRRRW